MKVDAGADFIATQLFYDVDVYLDWYKSCRKQGEHFSGCFSTTHLITGISVPILPGIMPIQSYQSFRRMVKLCKSHIPSDILTSLEPIQTDDTAVKEFGVDLAVSTINKLQANGISGVHISTLNLEKSVRRVVENLGWLHKAVNGHTQEVSYLSTCGNV
jgi:methylenetetrahydrofolate reductase (NADPH)